MTDDHPRAYDNSIYHGFICGQQVFKSDKTPLADGKDQLLHPRSPQDFTEVFHGSADQVAWINDIRMDREGRPYLGFSVQVNSGDVRTKQGQGGSDHRYYQARWDGAKWTCHEIAYAGTKLYAGEDDYTGLVALHPYDPDLVVISTNVDPLSGHPLVSLQDGNRHWELYRGSTKDDGVTWQWQP